jgi:hypothetical protein
MEEMSFWSVYGEAAKTAVGFFWKSGWAFVFGYFVSAMIQAFVPKKKLTRYMGKPGVKSVSLLKLFGAASSSCSFAALAAARALLQKSARLIVAVAFMFASTNLVIELGVRRVVCRNNGFIYSDLMFPPLVQVNAKYYGWKLALYIAATMFVSIVVTALILNGVFALLGIVSKSSKAISALTQFKID